MPARLMLLLLLSAALVGCGSAIGDACAKDQDCGGRTCDRATSVPGGYCTQRCTLGDPSSCPTGAGCVNHHANVECLRTCVQNIECRDGYLCIDFRGQGRFCLPPDDA
jgi:hypothetical protein